MSQSASSRHFDRLTQSAAALSRGAVWAGGALTLASVFLICFDVIARKFFGYTVGGADELSSYAFAISTTWSLAFALMQRANVRVDVIYQYFPPRLAAFVDWIAIVALAVFIVMLTRYAFDVVNTSVIQRSAANTPLATPLWIPQGLWFVGLVWMVVVLALMLLRASIALVKGDVTTVHQLIGVRTSKEEAQEEAEAGERMVRGDRP